MVRYKALVVAQTAVSDQSRLFATARSADEQQKEIMAETEKKKRRWPKHLSLIVSHPVVFFCV